MPEEFQPQNFNLERDSHDQMRFTPPGFKRDKYWLHLLLFIVTVASTIFAGYLLVGRGLLYERLGWTYAFRDGIRYSAAFLFFLTVHEFGHYFAARIHKIAVSLPYYIPAPLFFPPFNLFVIGSFGAVIRIKQAIPSTKKLFDVGAAGPLAGFVAAMLVLAYGIWRLPGFEYLLNIPGHHSIYEQLYASSNAFAEATPQSEGTISIYIGGSLLFNAIASLSENFPPMFELYHYPYLFAGWLGLFFTALNLLPVGQLDGGHIVFALLGKKWHGIIARAFVLVLVLSASIGLSMELGPEFAAKWKYGSLMVWAIISVVIFYFMTRLYRNQWLFCIGGMLAMVTLVVAARLAGPTVTQIGYSGWYLWTLLIVHFIKVDHPPVLYHEPLDPKRIALGILSIVIFVVCFSFRPIYLSI